MDVAGEGSLRLVDADQQQVASASTKTVGGQAIGGSVSAYLLAASGYLPNVAMQKRKRPLGHPGPAWA